MKKKKLAHKEPLIQSAEPEVLIDIQKVSYGQWVIILLIGCLGLIGLYEFYLPFLAERHYREGFNFGVNNRFDLAINEYIQAVQNAPLETQYQIQLGRTYEDYARQLTNPTEQVDILQKAEKIYHHIIEMDPLNPWFKNRLATIYLDYSTLIPTERAKYLSLAEEQNIAAANTDFKNPLFRLSLAFFYHQLNRLDLAEINYKKTLELDPDIVEALYNLADIYRVQGKSELQRQLYEEIYKISPDYQNISLILADDALKKKDLEKAKMYLEATIAKNLSNLNAIRLLLSIYDSQGEWEKAINIYQEVIIRYPDQQDLWQNYIRALIETKQYIKAYHEAQECLIRFPNNMQVKRVYQFLATKLPQAATTNYNF